MFRDLWALKIARVNIIAYVDIFHKAVIYTYFPYTASHCETSDPVVLNHYVNHTFIWERDDYPDKFRNFYRCPIIMSTYDFEPYMILIKRDDATHYYTDGLDGIVFRVISQRLNFTPIVIKTPLGGLGNCTSCLKCDCDQLTVSMHALKLVILSIDHRRRIFDFFFLFCPLQTKSGETNLSMGGIVQTDSRMIDFTASFPYIYSNMVFAIPKGRPYSSFEKLFFPFHRKIWILLSSFFVLGFLLLVCLRIKLPLARNIIVGSRSPHAAPYLNMVNIFLGGPLLFLPRTRTAVHLAVMWLLTTLVLRTAYQGHLFNMLQSDMTYPRADTLKKIHDSDFCIYSSTTFFNILHKNVARFKNRLFVYSPVPDSYEVLRDSSFNGVFLAAAEAMAAFNRKHIVNGTISITKERIFLLPVSIFFTRSSCLEPAFNDQILKFTSSGLIFTWEKMFIDSKYLREKRQSERRSEPEKLAVHQITGLLIILFMMHAISISIFIMEILSVKCVSIQRVFRYF